MKSLQSTPEAKSTAHDLILMYHRIADLEVDPWDLCVAPSRFDEQLALIAEETMPVTLTELTESPGYDGSLRIAVTFDDGYADNLTHALPIIQKYRIPATIFIVGGEISQNREFWWDELEQIILTPGELPALLDLQDENFTRTLTMERNYSQNQLRQDMQIAVFDARAGTRLFLFRELWELLSFMPKVKRQATLSRLWHWAKRRPEVRSTHQVLTMQELKLLSSSPLIEIGAHTMTHCRLPTLSFHEKMLQIEGSKSMLEQELGVTVDSFSYPFGQWDKESIEILKEVGFKRAVINQPGEPSPPDSPLRRKRITVGNWTGGELREILHRWCEAGPIPSPDL